MNPWNDWYHCMGNTYGTWLPGDPRGFRTRHHREHVAGDYRSPPPPDRYLERHRKSQSLLARPPVYLTPTQRYLAVQEFAASLLRRSIEVVAVSIDRIHFHVLARFPAHNPRHLIGIAKRETTHHLKLQTPVPPGGLWAESSECLPIHDRSHQLRTVRYILNHRPHGAAIWFLPNSHPHPSTPH